MAGSSNICGKHSHESIVPATTSKAPCFNFDVDDEDFEILQRGFVPENTSADVWCHQAINASISCYSFLSALSITFICSFKERMFVFNFPLVFEFEMAIRPYKINFMFLVPFLDKKKWGKKKKKRKISEHAGFKH